MKSTTLSYFLYPEKSDGLKISLDIFEAENYPAAVVVQQLVGNLVYYSNQGRYEPRIASSWTMHDPQRWEFVIAPGFKCENAETITAISFKKSLERSIKLFNRNGSIPIFDKLVGFEEFLKSGDDLQGISAHENKLEFRFKSPVRSGLIQFLSFAPFGYLCSANFNEFGKWKDKTKFISSGAYSVEEISIGSRYVLKQRPDWKSHKKNAPDRVVIEHRFPTQSDSPGIVDSSTSLGSPIEGYSQFELVPEYLAAVLLGNLKSGFFSRIENRKALRAAIESERSAFPRKEKNFLQSSAFYPSRKAEFDLTPLSPSAPGSPIKIEGKPPTEGSLKYIIWKIVGPALKKLGWDYRFIGNESTWKDSSNLETDIRFLGPSIGGGFEPWGIEMLFCSEIGGNLPDPSGRICKILNQFEKMEISEKQAEKLFFDALESDAAVLPIGHFGMQWYLTREIDRSSISPLVNIIRFDDLELK
jgi:hypothetical protein